MPAFGRPTQLLWTNAKAWHTVKIVKAFAPHNAAAIMLSGFQTRPPKIMKSKQLANVLIKVLGLSLCAQSVMHFVNAMLNIFAGSRTSFLLVNFLSGAILGAIGIFFIVKSRVIAGFLFKGEDE
jgi:hypothetical protein